LGGDAECEALLSQAQAELNAAKQEIAALKASAGTEQCIGSPEHISVLGLVSKTGGMAGSALQDLLDQTTVDEQVVDGLTKHYGNAKEAVGQFASIDYNGVVEKVKKHDAYVTHVAPTLEKVSETAKPYVGPALETAQTYLDQAKAAVNPHLETASKTVAAVTNDMPTHVNTLAVEFDRLLAPIYAAYEKAFKKVGITIDLPNKGTADKVFILLVTVFYGYNTLLLVLFLLKHSLKMVLKSTHFGILVFVKVPLNILLFIVRVPLLFLTCFYCCGLCRGKKARTAASTTPSNKNGNAKTNGVAKNGDAKTDAAKKETPGSGSKKGKKSSKP